MSNHTIIISGFPGVGKSYLTKRNSIGELRNSAGKFIEPASLRDSDSSKYSWIYKDGVKTDVRDPDFPMNYIRHIKELEKDPTVKVIFVSSHKVVRQALTKACIEYITIYPDKSMKDIYIEKYKERGNDNAFIKFIDSNWDDFIEELEADTNSFIIDRVRLNEDHSHIDMDMIEFLYMQHTRGCRL